MRRFKTFGSSRTMRGLSLIEMMVGVTVGLFIVAGATLLVSNQLGDSRRLMLETQVQQDLRATADIIVRDLRRAGYWGESQAGVWYDGTPGLAVNPYRAMTPTQVNLAGSEVQFAYSRSVVENGVLDASDQAGFRLNNGGIEMLVGGGGWQALTDTNTLEITDFRITLNKNQIAMACAKVCAPGAVDCPPRQELREIALQLGGRARHDASVARTLRSTIRLRNDLVSGACPA
jgi:prepilin peptidase dependent protein B